MSAKKQQPALPPGVSSTADLGTVLPMSAAATRLGVSGKTVRRMIDRGDLPGAHLVEMPGGKGQQWVVPVSAVEQHQAQQRQATPPDSSTVEISALRDQVTALTHRAELAEALADERKSQLEQLHLTLRTALPAASEPRRRWRK